MPYRVVSISDSYNGGCGFTSWPGAINRITKNCRGTKFHHFESACSFDLQGFQFNLLSDTETCVVLTDNERTNRFKTVWLAMMMMIVMIDGKILQLYLSCSLYKYCTCGAYRISGR
jgi:hypothetical protein